MSENINQTDGEQLFDTEGTEGSPETGTTTGELQLDSEESKGAKSPAQVNRDKQIAVWKARVDSGEVSIEEIPHKWIQDSIKPKQEVQKSIELDDDMLERKLEEREQRKAFDSRMKDISSMPLTKEQRTNLESEYNALKKGVKDVKALDAAIRLAGLHDVSVEQRRLANMRMPNAGTGSYDYKPDDIEKMSEDEIIKDSESHRRRAGGPPRI